MGQTATEPKKNSLVPGVLIVAFIAVAVIYYGLNKPNGSMKKTTSETTDTSSAAAMMASYKNGEYSMVGDYVSPGGDEQIGVKVTLENGVITAAEVTPMAERPNSVKFQGIFAKNFAPLIIGKNINEVKIDKVSGSSLSPKGFKDAIEKIKAEAKT